MSWHEAEERLDDITGIAMIYGHGVDGPPMYLLTTLKALRRLFVYMKNSEQIRDEVRMAIESDLPDEATIQITDEAVRVLG